MLYDVNMKLIVMANSFVLRLKSFHLLTHNNGWQWLMILCTKQRYDIIKKYYIVKWEMKNH